MGVAREELQKKEAIKDQQRKAAEKKADVSCRGQMTASNAA